MPKDYYAVVKGRKPGIYKEWYGVKGAKAQVNGFSKAEYQGFNDLSDAENWLEENNKEKQILRKKEAL